MSTTHQAHKELMYIREKIAKIPMYEIAKKLNISRDAYSARENGKTSFKLEEAVMLSQILKVPIEQLFPDFF